ncbi:MAG: magnesium transporter [Campylobacterota bacterium]|nr:magnesium transporter [Campylobacterota bacterium]
MAKNKAKKKSQKSALKKLLKTVKHEVEQYNDDDYDFHPYDLFEQLEAIREIDSEKYEEALTQIPHELFADVVCEMPPIMQEEVAEVIGVLNISDIATRMDTDDAADFIQNISEDDEELANNILSNFEDDEKRVLEKLISYDEHEAGAYMQIEMFKATIDTDIMSSLKELKHLKESDEVDNIYDVHVVSKNNSYIGSLGLEELIIFDRDLYYSDIPADKFKTYFINHKADIKEVVEMVSNYNLNIVPVVDDNNKLVGRITSDDIYDIIQESATEQIYNLAGVDDDAEQDEDIFIIGKHRAFWLSINLLTAIAASFVIGIFDSTIQSFVALAVLMPIVASMGGNAGTQTLTVTVRQMALGDIDTVDAKKTILKEVLLSLVNGLFFALIMGTIAFLWFDIPLLGVVIALSMVINLFSAGFFGAVIPLVLQRANIDPAIGSTVLLTTVTDIVGFFSFLGLATIILT